MSFGTTPTTSSQGALSTNQIPISSVAVPNASSGNLTALEGGPASTDSNGNSTAPAAVYVKDGSDLTQGAKADSAATDSSSSWSAIALLKGLFSNLATLAGAVSSSKVQSNVAQLAGTTTDTNSGSKSAGTLRVVLATDQPALTNKLLVTPDSVALPANQSVNISQINAVTPSMGNGVSGTGVQRVTIASDSTGQVALAAGAATIGAVTQASAPWTSNVTQISGSSISTAASGVQKVGLVGNAGATVDSTVGAGSAPTNAVAVGALYNSSAPAPTNGQAMALQLDQAGNMRQFPGIALATLSAWNSGTSLNATQNIFTNSGAEAVLVQLTQTTTLTAGAITFEVTYDNSNWSTIPAACVLDPTSNTFAQISLPYTVQASTNKAILINSNGAQGLRIKLSTQITGSGSVTPNYALLPMSPADTVIALSPTSANFNATVAQSGTWTVQPGNTPNTSAWLVQTVAGTSGGSTPFHALSAASNNATSVKASAGLVYGYSISNTNASARWFKLYDKSSSPNPASDTVKWAEQIPGNATVLASFPEGLGFSTGIAFAAVANISDTDNTSISANDLSIDIRYK